MDNTRNQDKRPKSCQTAKIFLIQNHISDMGEPMESDEDGGSDLGEVEFQEDSPVNPEVVELLSSDDDNVGKAAKKEGKAKNDVTTDVMEGENDITTEVVDLDAEDEKSSKAPKEKAGSSSKEKEKKKKKRQKPEVPSDESYYDSLSPKEMKYLKKNLLSEAELSQSSIVCTACYKQVNYKQEGAMMRHADLAVPVCKRYSIYLFILMLFFCFLSYHLLFLS